MSKQALALFSLCTILSACGDSSKESSSEVNMAIGDAENGVADGAENLALDAAESHNADDIIDSSPEAMVAATFLIADPGSGAGSAGVTVTSDHTDAITDEMGRATVDIRAAAPYAIALTKGDTRIHRVFGVAGEQDFEQITYMSPEMITSFVYNSLGLTDDAERGILVVGLDLPSLAPAVGAGATIDRPSDASFVFAGVQAVFATDIPTNGQGFLTFPNVEPGPVNVTVSYPSGTCRIFPAETESVPVEITAGEVSVVAYTCRPE